MPYPQLSFQLRRWDTVEIDVMARRLSALLDLTFQPREPDEMFEGKVVWAARALGLEITLDCGAKKAAGERRLYILMGSTTAWLDHLWDSEGLCLSITSYMQGAIAYLSGEEWFIPTLEDLSIDADPDPLEDDDELDDTPPENLRPRLR